ncbi:MAG: thiamine pyrophosphate-dependent enzyme [Candidatus Aenigmatarchaeota archaeon]|nr:2-oxoacid:ferredoxin oxidoreductase subunit beta [Candidatus Aenigmarchaeota archaeon]
MKEKDLSTKERKKEKIRSNLENSTEEINDNWKDVNETYAEKTWCSGCSNFAILAATKKALTELAKEGNIKLKNIVVVVGIGCHAKIYDYLELSSYYALHGRVLPSLLGIKLGNPELIPIGFAGDGDTYAEGMNHFIHSCKRNVNIKLFVHNNKVFALTTGQVTPTSEKGFIGSTTPFGNYEKPLNPILIALVSGATFVARAYALDVEHLAKIMKEAILHKGFAFIDILQPCITYHNTISYFSQRIYKLEDVAHNQKSFEDAMKKALEWDYSLSQDAKIPIGIFYKVEKETFEDTLPWSKEPFWKIERKFKKEIIEEFR